jgi:hypothetical protein
LVFFPLLDVDILRELKDSAMPKCKKVGAMQEPFIVQLGAGLPIHKIMILAG